MNRGILSATVMPSIGYAMSAGRSALGGRMSLPVAPALYIYSHFRHVSGVPAPEGTQGITISKLKILDTLIEQLSRIKNQGTANSRGAETMSDEQIDALIDQYEQQIRSSQAASQAVSFGAMPQGGLMFNLVA
ncbi:MAG: hypothetical protein LBP20_09405 [Treponema sp.]|jgi:hypothetical protein|nr:hypothetical protein [Treponema sp.]